MVLLTIKQQLDASINSWMQHMMLYLMGHSGRPHFASNGLLLEVTQADVAPDVSVKVK